MYCIPKSTGLQLATSTIPIDLCELFFYFLFPIYLCKHSMYAHPVSCRSTSPCSLVNVMKKDSQINKSRNHEIMKVTRKSRVC